jgi:sucrose-phosphate synthase
MRKKDNGLYIVLISVHGLIRGHDLELGRDADSGGQIKYVVELARALSQNSKVARVDLLTQRVESPDISKDYFQPVEALTDKAQIIRIDRDEHDYLPKEELWGHLDTFLDNALDYLRKQERLPDFIHSHYADAGYVGARISHVLGLPLVHTGHSLGRVKRRILKASGLDRDAIEQRYNISKRICAEEETLATADLVITSTYQEIDEQYGMYDHYQPQHMRVIPPGTDLIQFHLPDGNELESLTYKDLCRFLDKPNKPLILALSRPDQRKNIIALVEAYGECSKLQERANLLIVAGNRDDIRDMDEGAQEVLTELLLTVDQYDLYGKVAYPKHHKSDEVPLFYRLVTMLKGVFINPALTEPFGLTIIEAAASGVPVVATEDGGPKDILANCQNGYLINPLDREAIADALLKVLSDSKQWETLSKNGVAGVTKHYSWKAHVKKYLQTVKPLVQQVGHKETPDLVQRPKLYHDRAIFSDLDQNLLGDPEGLTQFRSVILENRKCSAFGIATGRRLDSALKTIRANNIPMPDALITSLGTEIYYAPNLNKDELWSEHIDHLWKPKAVRRLFSELPGLKLQNKEEQSKFKVSYYIDLEISPSIDEIRSSLHKHDLSVHLFFSFGQFLDIVPIRASKGFALRWYADRWDIPLDHILTAGGSGADEDMMRGATLAAVVAHRHEEELFDLVDIERIYYTKTPYARGIIEAIDHYDFFDTCRVPEK